MIKKMTRASVLALGLSVSVSSHALGLGDLLGVAGDVAKAAGASSGAVNALGAAGSVVTAVTLTDADVAFHASQMAVQIDKQSKIAPASSAYTKRLNKVVSGWQKTDGLKLNFKVYENKEVNAFAMADGTIRVNSGLMDLMTDDELRFVLAHEIGHVTLGHTKSQLRTALTSSAIFQGAAAAGGRTAQIAGGQYAALGEKFLSAQYSQTHESASDVYGLKLLKTKKIKPMAAVTALEKLATLGDGGGLMSSHPSSSSRAAKMRTLIGQ